MIKEQFEVTGMDGHIIVGMSYMPAGEIRGHVHIFHGMAEHQLRYEKLALFLTEQGYAVSTHDHRGHGLTAAKNDAPLGYFAPENGFEKVVEDAHQAIEYVRQQKDWPKPIILGHSMGSFIARRYIQLYSEEIQKVILMGTGAVSAKHKTGYYAAKILVNMQGPLAEGKLLDRLSFGAFNAKIQPVQTAFDWLSSNRQEVRKYLEDEYCGFISTNQFFVDLLSGMKTISKETEINKIRKDLPILLISGKEDPVGDYGKGVWKVAKQYYHAGFTNLAVYLFEHKRHEVLNEQNVEIVYNTILKWLEKKTYERATTV